MLRRLPGPVLLGVKSKIFLILVAIVLLAAGWVVYKHVHNPKNTLHGGDLSTKQLLDVKDKSISDALSQKNYQMATDSCLGASSDAYNLKQYSKSKSVLYDCINNIPDKSVPWYIYYSLAKSAHALNDTNLEKSSLQTAIKKANDPTSGTDQTTIQAMQAKLEAIK